jgi:gliding motility-associated-like protein
MKNLFLVLLLLPFSIAGQCDVAITDVNLNTYEVTVEVINSEGCLPAPIGGVSGAITMLQIGYHLPEPINPDNEIIEDFNETFGLPPCSPQWDANGYYLGQSPNSNHPGWWYSPSVSNTFDADLMGTNGLTTGDVVVIPLNPPGDYINFPSPTAECGDDLIDYWLSEGECIEFVVWQLNYGNTWHAANGGWAESANGYVPNPSTYQDQNCDNSWYMCRDNNPGAAVANPDFCDVYPLDIQLDSVWVTDAACDIYNIGACDAGLEWAFSYTNVGEEPIPSWHFEITGPNGYYTTTTDLYGVSANPPYDTALPPGESNIIINTNGNAWVGETELCVTAVMYDTDEPNLSNNTFCITLPPLPDCEGCTDPNALNYDANAVCNNEDECEYTSTDTIYIELPPDTILITDTLYVELPSDTIVITETDTLYVELPGDTIYETDTLIITVTEVDTLYIELPQDTVTVIEVDTIYVELPPDTIVETEFIFVTDTIFETDIVYITDSLYITLIDTIVEYQFIEIDCSTGLPCSDLGFDECEPLTVYIPNAFTPNNDGYNDAWEVVLDPGCWTDVILQVYSRWGNLVFESYDPYYLIWDGSNMGSSYYVPDGTYYWVFSGRKVNTTIIEELEGHITIFR